MPPSASVIPRRSTVWKRLVSSSAEKLTPLFDQMDAVNRKGGIAPAEAFAVHRDRLARRGDMADPIVRVRIERAGKISAADYIDMLRDRAGLVRAMDTRLADLDVLAMPTTPIVAPLLADVVKPDDFFRWNAQVLRNTAIWNFFGLLRRHIAIAASGRLADGFDAGRAQLSRPPAVVDCRGGRASAYVSATSATGRC